jgi:hypothetical protein
MKHSLRLAILLPALALAGCGLFTIDDPYGNSYGNFFDYGNQYSWQLATCEADPGLAQAVPEMRQRWMQCCMWRHGVPLDDAKGCDAPPYYNG